MNNNSIKYGEWLVRIQFPTVEQYDVNTRSGKEKAKRFECRLVSKNADEYCVGCVPFQFADPQAADRANNQLLPGTIWRLQNVVLMSKFNA